MAKQNPRVDVVMIAPANFVPLQHPARNDRDLTARSVMPTHLATSRNTMSGSPTRHNSTWK